MAKHRLSLPPAEWPADLRQRVEKARLTAHQRPRIEQGLGRWLLAAREEGRPADEVTQDLWLARSTGLRQELRNAMRQALALAFPGSKEALYATQRAPAIRRNPRDDLVQVIRRNLGRFPAAWRAAAEPLMTVDPDGIADGLLIQAWSPATIKRRLEAAALHFDACREAGLEPDITPDTIRHDLRARQAAWARGERRMGGTMVHLDSLCNLAKAVQRSRDWRWLQRTRDRLRKAARLHPSRNSGRIVDAGEFRAAGEALLAQALKDHLAATNHRQLCAAHTSARTAVTMILLSEAPIRLGTLVGLELEGGLLANLRMIILAASETKEKAEDARALSALLVRALQQYIEVHRPVVAPQGETRLFLGSRGKPAADQTLSHHLGKAGLKLFGRRTTPHSIRNTVATFIVAAAPEEAALASLILHHASTATTSTYHATADQISASRRLGKAAAATARAVGASTSTAEQRAAKKPLRERSLRAELAARKARERRPASP